MTFGELIERRRIELGISQRRLAKSVGVQPRILSEWERDKHYSLPRLHHFRALSRELNLKPLALVEARGYLEEAA